MGESLVKKGDLGFAHIFLFRLLFGFFFRLPHFFHQVAIAIAMHQGLVAVFAKVQGDIILIQLELDPNNQLKEIYGQYRKQHEECNELFEHNQGTKIGRERSTPDFFIVFYNNRLKYESGLSGKVLVMR